MRYSHWCKRYLRHFTAPYLEVVLEEQACSLFSASPACQGASQAGLVSPGRGLDGQPSRVMDAPDPPGLCFQGLMGSISGTETGVQSSFLSFCWILCKPFPLPVQPGSWHLL